MLSNLTKALILVFLSSLGCSAQVTFQKTYGGIYLDRGADIQPTLDGGYIILGYTASYSAGNSDAYLIKTDSSGNIIWTKAFGGTFYDDGAVVRQTSDGGYLISGNTQSFGIGSGTMYLIRTDNNGNLLWSRIFGPGGHKNYSCLLTGDGGSVISGYTSAFGAGNYDAYLIKSDSMGNLVWSKTYGGTAAEAARCIQHTNDGGFIITGYTHSYGVGQDDILVMKTDSTGSVLWAKTYGGAGDEYGNYIQQTIDGGFVVTGYTTSFGAGATDWFLIKADSGGNLQWSKTYGGVISDVAFMVQQTSDRGYFIGGYSGSIVLSSQLACIIKTDSIGNIICSKAFGGLTFSNVISALQTTPDNGAIACGLTAGFGSGNLDVYLIKTTASCASECNGYQDSIQVTNVPMQVTSSVPSVLSPSTTVILPATVVDSGGIQTNLCSPVGIYESDKQENSISLFPNPASEELLLTTSNVKPNTILNIYNFLGVKILEVPVSASQTNINVNSLPSGVYFITVKEGEETLGMKKFVKI